MAACSSSDDAKADTSTTKAPEDILVPAATVTAGLATLGTRVASAAQESKTSAKSASATVDEAWDQWLKIEGTIKKNDTGAYLEFEDALADMRIGAKDGDADKIQRGAASVTTLASQYLAKYPG